MQRTLNASTGRPSFTIRPGEAVGETPGNGLTAFQTVASHDLTGLPQGNFDVILANPPYYAYFSIARLFIDGTCKLGRVGGRFYLVTRQPDQVGPLMAEVFGTTQVQQRRGYTFLCASVPPHREGEPS